MSKYLWLCKINQQKHTDQKRSNKPQLFQRRSGLNIILLIIIVLLGAAYLIQVNRTATSGFAIDDLNRQIAQIKNDNQKLELQTADLQSLQKIQKASEEMQLVAHSKLEFVQPSGGAVALER